MTIYQTVPKTQLETENIILSGPEMLYDEKLVKI